MDVWGSGQDITNIVVVEDQLATARTIFHKVPPLRNGRRTARVVDMVPPEEALRRRDWKGVDCVLLDCYDSARQRANPAVSIFAGLEVALHLEQLAAPPRVVIAYSALVHRPEVHLPLRQVRSISAIYDGNIIFDVLPELIWGPPYPQQFRTPTAADYAALGVGTGAQLCEALRLAMSRPEVWELVARTQPEISPHRNARWYVNEHIVPLLDLDERSYRRAVYVLQQITRLPRAAWLAGH